MQGGHYYYVPVYTLLKALHTHRHSRVLRQQTYNGETVVRARMWTLRHVRDMKSCQGENTVGKIKFDKMT